MFFSKFYTDIKIFMSSKLVSMVIKVKIKRREIFLNIIIISNTIFFNDINSDNDKILVNIRPVQLKQWILI